jgi:microcystin-dependent protein
MHKIDFTQPNGFPLKADTLDFMQTAYNNAIYGLAQMAGSVNVIVSGCVDSGASVTDGWVYYNNELFFFQGGTKSTYFIIDETIVADNNQNGTPVNRYFTRKLRFGTGASQVAYDTLVRAESLASLKTKMYLSYFDVATILGGCTVSSVSGGNCVISAGTVMIQEKFLAVPSYSGAYPVYLSEQGAWSTSSPGGNFILFNPYTSQYLKHVYKRAVTLPGEILFQVVDINAFDGTGLGKWEYSGFALANGSNGTVDLRGRVPVGYDARVSDPANGVWDSTYNTVGATGGSKRHTLAIGEMPAHNHQNEGSAGGATYQDSAAGGYGLIRKSVVAEVKTNSSVDSSGSGTEPDVTATPKLIPWQGGGASHENRQPYMTLAFIQRL